jgi:hypothetical protein
LIISLLLFQISPQAIVKQPPREDGGPFFLQKVAKQYASKGLKAFNFGQFESKTISSQ